MDIKSANGKKPKKLGELLLTVLAVVIFLGAIGVAGYYYNQFKKATQDPNAVSQQEINELVGKVGKLITLPGDETPSVATVTDNSKLKDQPFFANSENGDKVLIYTKAKKAILFRPSTNKIIEVMPISFTDNGAAAAPAPAPAATPAPAKK